MLTFAQRIGARRQMRDQRMPTFVVGNHLAIILVHDGGAHGAQQHLVQRILEVALVDQLLVAARRGQRRLIDQVGEIGAGESGRSPRQAGDIDIGRQRNAAAVNLENRLRGRSGRADQS